MGLRIKSGHWYYRFRIKGKDHEGSTGLDATRQNENAAKAIEAQERLNIEGGEKRTRVKTVPFPVAAAEFLDWCRGTKYRQHPNSAKRIAGSFASLKEFFGDVAITHVAAIDIERYKTHRATVHQVKDCTLRNDLNALSLLFKYARRAGWCQDNPLLGEDKVERPSNEDAVRIHVVSEDEEEAYFTAAARPRFGNVRDLARLMVLQGPRPEEILAAKVSKFDERNGELQVFGKSRASKRTLYLQGESIEILARRKREATRLRSEWLFPSPRNHGYHIVKLDNAHDSVCQNASVSFVLYDFRHTFATRMLVEHKVDMVTLASIMGHSGIRILQKYVHPTAAHQKQAMHTYESQRKPKLAAVKG